jgi:hypothetical protein
VCGGYRGLPVTYSAVILPLAQIALAPVARHRSRGARYRARGDRRAHGVIALRGGEGLPVTSAATAGRLVVRTARASDIPGCVALQAEAWERSSRASEAQLRRRLERHPQGFFVALAGERVCGSLTTIRLATYAFDDPPGWYRPRDRGGRHATRGRDLARLRPLHRAAHRGIATSARSCARIRRSGNLQCRGCSPFPEVGEHHDGRQYVSSRRGSPPLVHAGADRPVDRRGDRVVPNRFSDSASRLRGRGAVGQPHYEVRAEQARDPGHRDPTSVRSRRRSARRRALRSTTGGDALIRIDRLPSRGKRPGGAITRHAPTTRPSHSSMVRCACASRRCCGHHRMLTLSLWFSTAAVENRGPGM